MSTELDITYTPEGMIESLLARLVEKNPEPAGLIAHVIKTVGTCLDAPAGGTMKAWMQAHNDASLTTLQIGRKTVTWWCPSGRVVDASRARSVRLGGSTRDYKGMRVLHVIEDALIVADERHVIAYVDEKGHHLRQQSH